MRDVRGVLIWAAMTVMGATFGSAGCDDDGRAADVGADAAAGGETAPPPASGDGGASPASDAGVAGDPDATVVDAGTPSAIPVYVVGTSAPTPTGSYSLYVNLLSSLEPTLVDLKQGLEVAGGGFVSVSRHDPNAIFIASSESPTLTRYDITAGGQLEEGPTVSFANQGLESAPRYQANLIYASPTKAFAVSQQVGVQVIVWNPTSMTIEKVIDVPGLTREGFNIVDSLASHLREDGKAFVPMSYLESTQDRIRGESILLVIDTHTDAVQALTHPCGGVRAVYPTPSGELLFGGSAGHHAAAHRLRMPMGAEPCFARIRKDATTPDPTFVVRGAELGVGATIADPSPSGAHLIFQALDETLAQVKVTTTRGELMGAPAWRYYAVPLASLDGADRRATPIAGLPVGRISSGKHVVDGRTYTQVTDPDGTGVRTQLYDVTDPANLKPSIRSPGYVDAFVRLR